MRMVSKEGNPPNPLLVFQQKSIPPCRPFSKWSVWSAHLSFQIKGIWRLIYEGQYTYILSDVVQLVHISNLKVVWQPHEMHKFTSVQKPRQGGIIKREEISDLFWDMKKYQKWQNCVCVNLWWSVQMAFFEIINGTFMPVFCKYGQELSRILDQESGFHSNCILWSVNF